VSFHGVEQARVWAIHATRGMSCQLCTSAACLLTTVAQRTHSECKLLFAVVAVLVWGGLLVLVQQVPDFWRAS
jgi:hypothetical protein